MLETAPGALIFRVVTQNLHVVCPHCHTTNRVARERLADGATCGKCREALLPGEPFALDAASFDRHVGATQLPLVVDFWAPWCGPCRIIGPIVEELAPSYQGRAIIAKVNVDDNPQIAQRYGITSIPTLMMFKDGKLVDRLVGAMPKGELQKFIDRNL